MAKGKRNSFPGTRRSGAASRRSTPVVQVLRSGGGDPEPSAGDKGSIIVNEDGTWDLAPNSVENKHNLEHFSFTLSGAVITPDLDEGGRFETEPTANLTIQNPVGTEIGDRQFFVLDIKDDLTARTLAYGSEFDTQDGSALPSTTNGLGQWQSMLFKRVDADSKWYLIGTVNFGEGGGGGSNDSVKVSANDSTTGFLAAKIVAGANITLNELNDGGNETLEIVASGGSGDMTAAVYDPGGVAADAFAMANMVEGATQKILTDVERSNISTNNAKVSADGSIDTHSDVDTTGRADGDIMTWNNGAGEWQPKEAPLTTSPLGDWRYTGVSGDADPGSGNVKFNNADLDLVTAVYLSEENRSGADLTNLLNLIANGDKAYFQVETDATKAVLFEVTGSVDNTTYFTLSVTYVSQGSGGDFANNDRLAFIHVKGASGAAAGTVKVSSNDTTQNYLENKINEGTGINVATNNDGGNENIEFSIDTDEVVTHNDPQTLTSKRIEKRVSTETSNATPAINADDYDSHRITAQAVNITNITFTGTPTDQQFLLVSITDDGTARSIVWDATDFEASTIALPTTTVAGERLDIGFVYNAATSKFRCIAVA